MKNEVLKQLQTTMDDREAQAVMLLLFDRLAGLSTADVLIGKADELPKDVKNKLMEAAKRVADGEPVQYVLGNVEFAGMELEVNPAVLIPRPETEELVQLIISAHRNDRKKSILDIGTGSGCIALALKKGMPEAEVTGWDISADALVVAKNNAQRNGLEITLERCDILHATLKDTASDSYDIIVSNPPYVCESEKADMEPHVVDYEPHTALFVPDEDPLLFYKAIATFAAYALKPDGHLYVEVNSNYTLQVKELFRQFGFQHGNVINDLFGNPRFVTAHKDGKENTD